MDAAASSVLTHGEVARTRDYTNLAEEIESVGRSEKRELGNRLEVLLTHLLKWQYQPEGRREGHSWADTIWEQRRQLIALLQAHGLDPAYLRHWGVVLGVGALLQRALDEAGLSGV